MRAKDINPNNPNHHDLMLLCIKPKLSTKRFAKTKAFSTHFCVLDHRMHLLQTFYSGVVFVFQQLDVDARAIHMNYVGVFKDIVQLDYGPVHTPIMLFMCEWINSKDNQSNDTHIKNDVKFVVVNFKHKLLVLQEPFIFPSQST